MELAFQRNQEVGDRINTIQGFLLPQPAKVMVFLSKQEIAKLRLQCQPLKICYSTSKGSLNKT